MRLRTADELKAAIDDIKSLLAEADTSATVLINHQVDREECRRDSNQALVVNLKEYGKQLAEGRYAELVAREQRMSNRIDDLKAAHERANEIWVAFFVIYGELPYHEPQMPPNIPYGEDGKLSAWHLPHHHVVQRGIELHRLVKDVQCSYESLRQKKHAIRVLLDNYDATGDVPHFVEAAASNWNGGHSGTDYSPAMTAYLKVAYAWLEAGNQPQGDRPTELWKHIADITGKRRDAIIKTFKRNGLYDPHPSEEDGTPTEGTVRKIKQIGQEHLS